MTASGVHLGPLTTTWSPPAGCSFFFEGGTAADWGYVAQTCVAVSGTTTHAQDDPNCWPPRTASLDFPRPPEGWGYYSPGLACPSGYTPACTATYSGKSDWSIQFTLAPSETAVGCCPTGYACSNYWETPYANTCVQTATGVPPVVAVTAHCSGSDFVSSNTVTFPDVITLTNTVAQSSVQTETLTRHMRLLAPMIQLNFQPTDITTATATSTPGSDSDAGLSTGAKAGIGVGVGVGVPLIVGLVAWYILWRKRSQRVSREGVLPSSGGFQDAGMGELEHRPISSQPYGKSGSEPSPPVRAIAELSPDTHPAELP